jgi:hypothetical protein
MIKKILPFLLSIIILVLTILLPYFLFFYQDYSLFNQAVVEDIKNEVESENLSVLDVLETITYGNESKSDSNSLADGYTFAYRFDNDQIDKLYSEVKKLYQGFSIKAPTKDDISNYYECTICTFKNSHSVTMYYISFTASQDGTHVSLWLDSQTMKIYQIHMINKNDNINFIRKSKEHDFKEAYMNYLGIDEKIFDQYYLLSVESYLLYINVDMM